ncbi:MAG TPA: hypothetical protein GXZ40_02655 [Bacteroidales bacterium]|nr:hypothetical protein [Bacteroidales bacterium]
MPADLEPGADPERSEGARPNKKYNHLLNPDYCSLSSVLPFLKKNRK